MPRDNTIEVILNEGRGYRLWKWNPNLTEHEFPLWWGDMRDSDFIKFYFNIRSLPGKVVPYKAMTNGHSDAQRMPGDPLHFRPYYYCHFHEMHDSFIAVGELARLGDEAGTRAHGISALCHALGPVSSLTGFFYSNE